MTGAGLIDMQGSGGVGLQDGVMVRDGVQASIECRGLGSAGVEFRYRMWCLLGHCCVLLTFFMLCGSDGPYSHNLQIQAHPNPWGHSGFPESIRAGGLSCEYEQVRGLWQWEEQHNVSPKTQN